MVSSYPGARANGASPDANNGMRLALSQFVAPVRPATRSEVLAAPSAVSPAPGVYGWYFRDLPPQVPLREGQRVDEWSLAYVALAPKSPPHNGAHPSKQN